MQISTKKVIHVNPIIPIIPKSLAPLKPSLRDKLRKLIPEDPLDAMYAVPNLDEFKVRGGNYLSDKVKVGVDQTGTLRICIFQLIH